MFSPAFLSGQTTSTLWPTACIACSNTNISYSSLNSPTSIRIFLPAIAFLRFLPVLSLAIEAARCQPASEGASLRSSVSGLGGRSQLSIRATRCPLYVVHQRKLFTRRESAHIGEGLAIEHVRDRVPRGDHGEPDRACLEVGAIVARPIGGHRRAGDRGQGTVKGAHDCADPNLMRRAGERVAAALSLLGVDEAGVTQLCQNVVEKLLGDRIGFGDIRGLSKLVGSEPGEMDHCFEAIFSLLGQHEVSP